MRGSYQRPPWTNEARVREHCVSCGDCMRACPVGIITVGPAGTPTVDFNIDACTFCGACADACHEDVFRPTDQSPWSITAEIAQSCFLNAGIACRSCTDACDRDALVFDLRAGVVGRMSVAADLCTGCGACVSSCPAEAISVGVPVSKEVAA